MLRLVGAALAASAVVTVALFGSAGSEARSATLAAQAPQLLGFVEA